MESIAPAVGPETTVVPMLNGHAHFGVLDKKFGADKVAGGLARIGGMLGPNGEVMHSSAFAGVSFGERSGKPVRASLVELDAACKKAGIDGGLNANINQDLWDKWIMLTSLAAMCCTMRGTTADIMAADEGEALMGETVDECRKVAAAEGFDPGDKSIANLKTFLTRSSRFAASMLDDLEKGGRSKAAMSSATCWDARASSVSPRPTSAWPMPSCRPTRRGVRARARQAHKVGLNLGPAATTFGVCRIRPRNMLVARWNQSVAQA